MVSKLTTDTTELELVNLSISEARDVIVQAGSMGEHHFTTARFKEDNGDNTVAVDGTYLQVHLPPNTHIVLAVGMERFVNAPSYQLPW